MFQCRSLQVYVFSSKTHDHYNIFVPDPRVTQQGDFLTRRVVFQAVFERLVDIICDKMSESLDTDPNLVNANKGTRLIENPQQQNGSCQC